MNILLLERKPFNEAVINDVYGDQLKDGEWFYPAMDGESCIAKRNYFKLDQFEKLQFVKYPELYKKPQALDRAQ